MDVAEMRFRTDFTWYAFDTFCSRCVEEETKIGMTESGVFFTGKHCAEHTKRFAGNRDLSADLKTYLGCGDKAAWE